MKYKFKIFNKRKKKENNYYPALTSASIHMHSHICAQTMYIYTHMKEGRTTYFTRNHMKDGRKQGRVRRGEKGRKKGRSFKRKMMNHTKKLSKLSILCRETAQKDCCHVLYGKARKPELELSSSNSFLKAKRASHILFFSDDENPWVIF